MSIHPANRTVSWVDLVQRSGAAHPPGAAALIKQRAFPHEGKMVVDIPMSIPVLKQRLQSLDRWIGGRFEEIDPNRGVDKIHG
jgi:hypothetical protein